MPLLSFVIPVHGVQGYLRECLDSILGQSFTDFELIAVDDASTDHCGQILDSYGERDARIRVMHLESNVGLGEARNIGLAEAVGEYVWFVDSDDWIAPGCLRAIAARLRAEQPDVLLLNHTRVSWMGQHSPSDGGETLGRVESTGPVSLADEPALLNLFTVAWNKVLRREFLERTSIRFDDGWYEDLPFTFPALVAADRISATGRVCYHYRKRRTAGITSTSSDRHFEVFDQWGRVFQRLDALGERAEPYRSAIFDRMVWHLLVVHSRPDRLPRHQRRTFFGEVARFYQRYQVDDTPPADRLDRVRHSLVATNGYHRFRGLKLARGVLGRADHVARTGFEVGRVTAGHLARGALATVGHAYYHLQRRLPLEDDLALYASYWYRGMSCNPAAIYGSARDLAPRVRGLWVVARENRADMPPGVPHVVAGTPSYYRALARAKYLINNVNYPDFVRKRRGSVHLQTHHGTPVKVMGLDQGAFPIGAKGMDLPALVKRCDRWDYSLSSNAHSTEMWSRSYPARYETLEYGYPRNDRLALAEPDEIVAARDELGADGRTVVLYAPTHREYAEDQQPVLLDAEHLAEALGRNYLVLVRSHYFHPDGPVPQHPRVRDVTAHPRIEDLLLATDILVTDYSSVMFDFAVLDRPIIVYAPDWDTYKRTRGVTFDLLAEPPGAVAMTQADLIDTFITGEVYGELATKARAQFRERFCYLDDGRAADRVVRRVFADMLG